MLTTLVYAVMVTGASAHVAAFADGMFCKVSLAREKFVAGRTREQGSYFAERKRYSQSQPEQQYSGRPIVQPAKVAVVDAG